MLQKGEVAEVVFEMEAATAWQFTLAFDAQMIEFQEVVDNEAGLPNPAVNEARGGEGLVSMLYFGQQPVTRFALKIKALTDLRLEDALQISSEMTPAAAWNEAEEQLEVVLDFGKTAGIIVAAPELLGCQPNPFAEQTVISFSLPTASEARFSFFDATGKKRYETAGQFGKGKNSLTIQSKDLGTVGLVFLKMEAAGVVRQEKLVVMR